MNKLYSYGFYENNDKKTIINYINKNKDIIFIPNSWGVLPIHIYCWCKCEKSKEIINLLINYEKKNLLIRDKWGKIPIHYYCWGGSEKSKKIINLLINNNPNNLLILNNDDKIPIELYCLNNCKKTIDIIDYLLYNYDINNIDYIQNCPTYVGYYLYKIYKWKFYNKKLFLYMLITKLQKLIKVYLIKKN